MEGQPTVEKELTLSEEIKFLEGKVGELFVLDLGMFPDLRTIDTIIVSDKEKDSNILSTPPGMFELASEEYAVAGKFLGISYNLRNKASVSGFGGTRYASPVAVFKPIENDKVREDVYCVYHFATKAGNVLSDFDFDVSQRLSDLG